MLRTSGGREPVRAALHMGAVTASQFNPVPRAMRRKMQAEGKAPMVIMVAITRKLLTILNAIVRSGQPWRSADA